MKEVTMFCGKGGVGKTTCAAATALHYAEEGKETLIISTDLTPSLRDIFELEDMSKPAKIMDRLYLDEIGSEEVKRMWKEKFGAEVYEVFSSFVDIGYTEFSDFVASILPGIRDEFMVDYIREIHVSGKYEHIVWDTAPAGQTLGLLQMPAIVNDHLKPAPRIYASLKGTGRNRRSIQGVIKDWEELSKKDMAFLKEEVEFEMVTIAEALAVRQLEGICAELTSYGLSFASIIVNHVVTEPDSDFLRRKSAMQQRYLSEIVDVFDGRHRILPMFPEEVKGMERLRGVAGVLFGKG